MFSRLRHRRVALTLSNGEMFKGTVAVAGRRHLTLVGVEAIVGESLRVVPGGMRFDRAFVMYLQEL